VTWLVASLGSTQPLGAQASRPATIRWAAADAELTKFPVRIPRSGPTALHIQILLDLAHFSPGIIDGSWGNNAGRALAFFDSPDGPERLRGGTPPTLSHVERATYERLRSAAGNRPLLTRYTLTAGDVGGPFTEIPSLVYDQAKLKCLCYATAAEAIAEKFHTSRALLEQLNRKVNFDKLAAGIELVVPNVASENVASSMDTVIVAKLIISKTGFWTHAVDAAGRILAHYPSTLGAGYDPSPTGSFRVTYVARDPAFHYQPKLFAEVPDDKPEARLPPGPNSPVGRVWMSLSKPHYGIHGTSSPETIGYAASHGCVRLTNWDALQLSDFIEPGTPVEFH
jgi:lipoprotein-anchoring transpeptidase ErfK/SrfK